MANTLYDLGRQAFANGDIQWKSGTAQTFKAALVDTGTYTLSQSHQFYSDLSGVVGTPGAIANPSNTSGICDGDNVTFTSVSGNTVEAIVIYQDTGTTTTSPLLAYIDTTSDASLPVTPNGGNITIAWSDGADKIFKL